MTIEESITKYPELAIIKKLVEDHLANRLHADVSPVRYRIVDIMINIVALMCIGDAEKTTNIWYKYIKDAADDCRDRVDQIMI